MSAAQTESLEAFSAKDWGLLVAVALMWGGSFVLMDLGLQGLHPATITWLRLLFGVATLACMPAARRPLPRAEWPMVALLGTVWMAVPFLLFPVAQQWIASSLAGMINGAAPLFTAAVAALCYRRAPRRWQLAGLLIGFAGVLTIYWPTLDEMQATALGAGLILLATLFYGIAFNLAGPLQKRNGALPVIWRALLVALALSTPYGLYGLQFADGNALWFTLPAMAGLGVFATGLAFVAFVTLIGRVGAPRGSVTVYFIPVVAILLGVALLGETVEPIAIAGTALVLLGAYLTSRRQG
ncbi:DMT family transporter [Aquibaculum arenosum]|uniref:DMT family transporter n=1 Tax=Aquibaculum arenosum TaxID=3032591 RepID=A0ABT5YNU7_9PROT|nr:DMT family transporter [Fodinicurvata sp. CAU 1616]MDF2096646.1 DMT family transporter [Fodinicurvata sp. CAU 1616]